ncbi:unnamed protein product [Soboliphyme baturini]|uniref:Methyltransferase n=1 Tax=Soboliphyme baturini TaxID=241478 RepID=A0A183J5V6_9BILA|nr:unnamed protein product [Soboliphyme baturini]
MKEVSSFEDKQSFIPESQIMAQRLPSFRAFNRLLKLDAVDDYSKAYDVYETEDKSEQKDLVQFYLTTLCNIIERLTKPTLAYRESRFLNVGGGLAFLCALIEGKTISDVYVTDWTKDNIYEQRRWLEDEQGKDLSAIDMLNAFDNSNTKAALRDSNAKVRMHHY